MPVIQEDGTVPKAAKTLFWGPSDFVECCFPTEGYMFIGFARVRSVCGPRLADWLIGTGAGG